MDLWGKKWQDIYVHELSSFGSPNLGRYPVVRRDDNSLDEIELEEKNNWIRDRKIRQDLIKREYRRIQEKIKEIQQNVSREVISGRCSGSGKVVLEFYDDLVKLWGCSPATESLTCCISSEDINLPSCSSTGTSTSFNNDTNESDEDNNGKNTEFRLKKKKKKKSSNQYHSLSTININILSGSSVRLKGISFLWANRKKRHSSGKTWLVQSRNQMKPL